jgi:probable rRNA maturation factor
MEPPSSSSSLTLDIAVNAPVWNTVPCASDEAWVTEQLAPLFSKDDIRLGELSIALIDDAQMQTLNHQYRDKDRPTNVLSFPADEPLLGDIVLSYETIAREAAEKNVTFEAHLSHLLIHGFLHLQGYDHQTEADAQAMEALEIDALAALGIDNPYELQTVI